MFKDAKVGDRVWDLRYGWGEVEEISSGDYPVEVCFAERDVQEQYTRGGKVYLDDQNPTLFWDEIKFEIPEKPERVVDRTFEGWVNVYENSDEVYFHEDRETADDMDSDRLGCYRVTVILKGVPEGTNLEGALGGLREI